MLSRVRETDPMKRSTANVPVRAGLVDTTGNNPAGVVHLGMRGLPSD